MIRDRPQTGQEGFSLVELMVAVFLLVVVLGGLYVVFQQTQEASEKGYRRVAMYRRIRDCLGVVTDDLRSAFLSSGDARLVFLGDEKQVRFCSACGSDYSRKDYELREISYEVREGELRRRVRSMGGDSPGTWSVLAEGVWKVQFAYHDTHGWISYWDSRGYTSDDFTDDKLPVAVRITVCYRDGEERPLKVTTTAHPASA